MFCEVLAALTTTAEQGARVVGINGSIAYQYASPCRFDFRTSLVMEKGERVPNHHSSIDHCVAAVEI
jgi:hypothetical protein